MRTASASGFVENDRLGGHEPYGASKAAAEIVAAVYRNRSFFSADGSTAVATARAGNVIGGGDFAPARLVPDVVRAILDRTDVVLRYPNATAAMAARAQPASGYLRLAERAWADRALARGFNFGPAEEDVRPVGWIVEQLAVPSEVDDGPHPHEAHWLKLDSSLARSALGWRPAWDLTEGLRHTADWYRAHRTGEDVRATTRAQLAAFG